jgi:hypothetical protein
MMPTLALMVRIDAKRGKERDVEALLRGAIPLSEAQNNTQCWSALKMAPEIYGLFATFDGEAEREGYLSGPLLGKLTAKADELLLRPPVIEKVEVLASRGRTPTEVVDAIMTASQPEPVELESRPAATQRREVPKVGSRDAPGG